MKREIDTARNWYWWLWLSPLITVPTMAAILIIQPGYAIVCAGPGRCDNSLADQVTLIAAVLVSSIWHLILLLPVSEKRKPFVRWHGLQALSLAGLRAGVALFFAAVVGYELAYFIVLPMLLLIMIVSTPIGQHQATRGKCSLASWLGHGNEISSYGAIKKKTRVKEEKVAQGSDYHWVNIIRYNNNPQERRRVLVLLKERDMVEEF